MYQKLLTDSSFYPALLQLEEELALETRAGGCRYCGGKLHSAGYRRKPRGVSVARQKSYCWRFSFCCAEEGCRRRTFPPSVLFLGRKVYFGAVLILVCVLRHGPNPTRLEKLRDLVGVSGRTVRRWQRWWLDEFVRSSFWKAAQGRLRTPADESKLPVSLMEAFVEGSNEGKLLSLLRFVSPITTGSMHFGHTW